MHIKKFYSNLSIKYKLIIFVYTIILLISLAFGFYSYSISKSQVIEKVSTANSEAIRQIGSNIEFLQKDVDQFSTYICTSKNIQQIFSQENSNYLNIPQNDVQKTTALDFILNAIVSKDYVDGIILYNKYGAPIYYEFTDGSSGISDLSKSNDYTIYKKLSFADGHPTWFTLNNRSDFLIHNNITPKISIGRLVKNVYNTEPIGSIFIFIDKKYIESLYTGSIKTDKDSIFIVDENNEIVSSVGAKLVPDDIKKIINLSATNPSGKNYITQKINNDDMLINSSKISPTGWKLYYLTPTNTMISQINTMKYFTILIIFSCIIFSFPLLILITSYFTNPIQKLLRSMERFQEGNFDEHVNIKTTDEMGLLGQGYNNMIQNIKDLIKKTYILQIKEKEAELDALQAQINPHFLYNTLNSIYWKAQKNKQPEIAEMTMLLSKMFRLTLNRGNAWTTIQKENEFIDCYLKLQKTRFNDRLSFSIDIDNEIRNLAIPKFILQPFVENAVLHGIDDKSTGVNVIVTGKRIDDTIKFTIHDTGLGMSKEVVDKLNSLNFEFNLHNQENNGYALKNITDRLTLLFNDKYTVFYTSELGNGTSVDIIIPAINEMEVATYGQTTNN